MQEMRRKAGLMIDSASLKIKSTEELLESFYPNVQRIMNEQHLRNSLAKKKI